MKFYGSQMKVELHGSKHTKGIFVVEERLIGCQAIVSVIHISSVGISWTGTYG